MRKLISVFLIIAISITLLTACAAKNAGEDVPKVDYTGFKLDGELKGGGTVSYANLRSVNVSVSGSDTVLKLDFVSNSELSGEGVQREVGNPPKYRIYTLDKPYRLVVEVEALYYWDYERDAELTAAPIIRGSFNYSPEQGGLFRLYINLTSPVAFKVDENDGVVSVTLRKIVEEEKDKAGAEKDDDTIDVVAQAPEGQAYYIIANAYEDQCRGVITAEGMTPTLAADGTNIMLISEPYSTETEALVAMEDILSREEHAVESDWSVKLLSDNQLPEYNAEMEYLAAYDVAAARVDGEERVLDVLIAEGIVLTAAPDGDELLFSRRISEYEAGGDTATYEMLYLYSIDTETERPLVDFKFQTIESALYSPDGRKLAVLERSGEAAHLYVFDVDSRDLITDLASVGFGDIISAYCWDNMGGRIFSIGGSYSIGVNQYDFNVPSETARCTVVDDKGADEGSIAFINGEVYFAESTMEDGGMIYRIKPEGGLRRSFINGETFELSPDSRYIAFANNSGDTRFLKVMDISSGRVTDVAPGFGVYKFMWSEDASVLYYFENMLSGDEGESGNEENTQTAEWDAYPYRLWAYDMAEGKKTVVADLTTTNISFSDDPGVIYVGYTDPETLGEVVRATYALKLN